MEHTKIIEVGSPRPVEFLVATDLETILHPGEDERLGVHSRQVLREMAAEARCEGAHRTLSTPDFMLFNGDQDARHDESYNEVWEGIDALDLPVYYTIGNHESGTFDGDGERWCRHFGYDSSYYAWEYRADDPATSLRFIAIDAWTSRTADGDLEIREGSGNQVLRQEQKVWLKELLDSDVGTVVVMGHAHIWPPAARAQDNEDMEELVTILRGTYEGQRSHRRANAFINGGHHNYPGCTRPLDGVFFIDPAAGIHGGYARVRVDPVQQTMAYFGRGCDSSYVDLDLRGIYPR